MGKYSNEADCVEYKTASIFRVSAKNEAIRKAAYVLREADKEIERLNAEIERLKTELEKQKKEGIVPLFLSWNIRF